MTAPDIKTPLPGPNAKALIADGYMGAIASILCDYPRAAALRCCSPRHGVAATTNFVPTAADVIKWLERELVPYRSAHDREQRVAEQFAERRRIEEENKAEPLEHRRKVGERIKRELHEAFADGRGEIPNLFVPSFAPRFKEMCERAEREPPERAQYGHSLEDRTRMGIWVPLEWYRSSGGRSSGGRAKKPWQRLSDAALRSIYPPKSAGEQKGVADAEKNG